MAVVFARAGLRRKNLVPWAGGISTGGAQEMQKGSCSFLRSKSALACKGLEKWAPERAVAEQVSALAARLLWRLSCEFLPQPGSEWSCEQERPEGEAFG